jgi:hypothetical protein
MGESKKGAPSAAIGESKKGALKKSLLSSPAVGTRTPTASKKRVWFDTVEVAEYPYALGDNPAVKEGPPLTIGWKRQHRKKYEIDYYEVYKEEPRKRSELRLSANQRTKL